MDQLTQLLHGNQFLAGGFILGVIASVGLMLRRLAWWVITQLKLLFFCECYFESNYDFLSINWLMNWVASHEKVKKSKRVTIRCRGGNSDVPELTPAPGRHFLKWRGRHVIIDRTVTQNQNNMQAGRTESWTLYLQGGRKHLDEFINECREQYHEVTNDYVNLFVSNCCSWEHRAKPRRPLSTVILPFGLRADVLQEMEQFWNARERYARYGRPWRMGYLLEGSPGNGKTSFVLAVASHFRKDVYMWNLSTVSDGAEAMAALLRIPNDCILLIEDMDRDLNNPLPLPKAKVEVFAANEPRPVKQDPDRPPQPISLSLLLQALDGLPASEGRLLFVTTNHPERIDPALLRPGRIDRRISFEPSPEQYMAMFQLFFPDQDEYRFADALAGSKPSLAAVQEYLVRHQHDVWEQLAELAKPNNAANNGHAKLKALIPAMEG